MKKKIGLFKVTSLTLIIFMFMMTVSYNRAYAADNSTKAVSETKVSTADENSELAKANKLSELGIVIGNSEGFQLDKQFTRAEAAVVIIRLLDMEKEVKAKSYKTPFTDVPAWASSYVGYLYENKMSNGTGKDTYGAYEQISMQEYITLIARILGYKDEGDFKYQEVLRFALDKYIITPLQYNKNNSTGIFTRGDMVDVTYGLLMKADSDQAVLKAMPGLYRAKEKNVLIDWWNDQTAGVKKEVPDEFEGDTRKRVVLYGDSLTEGITLYNLLNSDDNYLVVNKGKNGATIERLTECVNEVLGAKPDYLFIMAGTNNFWGGDKGVPMLVKYREFIKEIRTSLPDTKIFIQSTMPFGRLAIKENSVLSFDELHYFNLSLKNIATDFNCKFIDVSKEYEDSEGFLKDEVTRDGIHILLPEYQKWVDMIKKEL